MRLIPTVGDYLPLLAAAFFVAALLSLFITPLVRRVAIRLGNVDHPGGRRVNKAPVPRGGGVAVAISFLVVALGGIWFNGQTGSGARAAQHRRRRRWSASCSAARSPPCWASWTTRSSSPPLAAARPARARPVAVLPDHCDVHGHPLGREDHPRGPFAVGFPTPVDRGHDQQQSTSSTARRPVDGITLIAAVTLGPDLADRRDRPPFIGILCFGLAGSLLGFLRWNFHPATIFIGTSGVMFVGYTLAVLSILGTAKVAVALLVLGVPIIDTFWIIVRRIRAGSSPFTPDRGHIHHRLLDLGLSHSQTVLVIYGLCMLLAVLSLVLSGTQQLYSFMGLAVIFGLVLFLVNRNETSDALEAETYDEGPEPGA